MRINNNISSMITQTSLSTQQKGLGKSLEKLSTGMRINRASDDAAGLSISEALRSQVRGMDRARSNAEDGIALLNIAEGATGEINNILQRMRELAVQSSTDTLTDTEREYTDAEFQELVSEIDRIAGATNYNGQNLLDETGGADGDGTFNFHVGAGSDPLTDQISVDISAMDSTELAIDNSELTTASDALDAIDAIDEALATVNTLRSTLGAATNRLEFTVNNLSNQMYNVQDAESRIRDVDFAKETTEFTRTQILTQSATSMLAQANAVPQGVLSLLG